MPTRCAPTVNVGNFDELLNPGTPSCFTDNSGTTFFGIWEVVDGSLQLVYYELDNTGALIPYTPTSTPLPCDPNVTTQSEICWIAIADGVGYSSGDQISQILFFDTSTTPATVTATIWYNLSTSAIIATPPDTADRTSCAPVESQVVPGRIETCVISESVNTFDVPATFDALNAFINTLATDAATEATLREQIADALEVQREQEAKGVPVTSFRITTATAVVYEFLPSALIPNVVTGLMSFQAPDTINWPTPLVDNIVLTEYDMLSDCMCEDVEMLQRANADNTLTLLGVFRPRVLDVDGNKESIALPLPIGQLGPFPGQCQGDLDGLGTSIPGCYQDANGNYFDATVMLNDDGTVDQVAIHGVVTDTTPGTLIVGRPCYACCVPSRDEETFQHAVLPHADIATSDGFIAGTTEYNGRLCGDTISLDPFDLTVVATEVTTSPDPIFTWSGAANGGAHRIVISNSGTVRMGFASCDGGMNETVEFITSKPDRIFPGTGSTLANQAALDAATLPIVWHNANSADATYFEWDNVESVPFTVNAQDTITMRGFVDSVTFDNATKWTTDDCCGCDDEAGGTLSVGYLQTCDSFDITLPINIEGSFSDNAAATSTLTSTTATITLIADSIRQALEYETAEVQAGLTVTNFVIRADDGSVFEFPPSAFVSSTGSAITLTTADLVAWPGPLNDRIQRIEYSKFDNCGCSAVEMLQKVNADNTVELLKVLDPSVRDENGLKLELTTPFTFGISGPFAGPCPSEIQALEIDSLCCDSDLANNNPDVATQRLAWLDGADTARMLDAVGGVPIAGNQGDQVFEVQDKLTPGVAPSFVIPTTGIGPGDTAPINPPTLNLDSLNGLPTLTFNSANRERMRLDTDNPNGNSFTFFYLLSATDITLASFATILGVGPFDSSDGGQFNNDEGAWQLGLSGNLPSFMFRFTMNAAEYALGVDPVMIVQTGPFSNENSPANPNPLGPSFERAISTDVEFFDGQFHLLTVQFDDATNIQSIFFDGQLRVQIDWTGFPLTVGAFASDYFRLFGNRIGGSFLSGQLAELFFADVSLTPEEIGIVNAYLICKWGIDPTLAAGGAGDLTLAPAGTYSTPTDIVRILRADGKEVFRNTSTGLEFPVPPVPGLSVCAGGGALGFDTEFACFEDANQQFIRHTVYDVETGAVATVFDTEMDMVTTYNTIGGELPCAGEAAAATVFRGYARAFNGVTAPTTLASLLQGGTLTGMSITTISSATGTAQYTDSGGTTTPMYTGQTKNVSAEDMGNLDDATLAIELTDAADVVIVDWTERV